jgi:hypothetical protein
MRKKAKIVETAKRILYTIQFDPKRIVTDRDGLLEEPVSLDTDKDLEFEALVREVIRRIPHEGCPEWRFMEYLIECQELDDTELAENRILAGYMVEGKGLVRLDEFTGLAGTHGDLMRTNDPNLVIKFSVKEPACRDIRTWRICSEDSYDFTRRQSESFLPATGGGHGQSR